MAEECKDPQRIFPKALLAGLATAALINMLMASRLLYGMANERILPKIFGTVHPFRRTPWVSILITSLIAALLLIATAGTGAVSKLGGTTALLLLCVFTVVNIALLVLRKDKVEHRHFHARPGRRSWAACCARTSLPWLSGRPASDYYIGLILVGIGILFWFLNWVVMRSRG
jgi:APA family basic amino acid/polyamine antiporter